MWKARLAAWIVLRQKRDSDVERPEASKSKRAKIHVETVFALDEMMMNYANGSNVPPGLDRNEDKTEKVYAVYRRLKDEEAIMGGAGAAEVGWDAAQKIKGGASPR